MKQSKGFSLIEVIVALITASILATIIIQVMGTNYKKSAESLKSAGEGLVVRNTMESIVVDYWNWLASNPNQTIADFSTIAASHDNPGTVSVTTDTSYVIDSINGDSDIGIVKVEVNDPTKSHSLVSIFTK